MKNKVQLLQYAGGDKRFCLSAWQSTTGELGIKLPDNIKDRVDVIFKHICKLNPIGAKRAKETTRYFLTYATQLNFDVAL